MAARSSAIRPSTSRTVTLRTITATPWVSLGPTSSSIAAMILGTPARTKTLPIWKAGRDRYRILDQAGAFGHPRHALPPLVEIARFVARGQERHGLGMGFHGKAEGGADGIGGDIVMGRTDAARGENIAVARAERVNRGHDLRFDIAHEARLGEVDAEGRQELRDGRDIHVLGASRQDLVANDQNGGGDQMSLIHRFIPRS